MRRQRLRLWWWFACFAGACWVSGAPAQTLRISPQTSVASEWVTLEIAFQPATSGVLTALQWDIEIPVGVLDLDGAPLTRVPLVVKDAGKSVVCASSKKSAELLLLRCILAGGQTPIPAATIVLLSMKTGSQARLGVARVRLQNASGVTRDAKEVPIEAAEGLLTIRAR